MASFAPWHFHDVKPVQPAITSLAVQLVEQQLRHEAEIAIKPESGLYVHIPSAKRLTHPVAPVADWRHLGAKTRNDIAGIHQQVQPLLWALLTLVATPDHYRVEGTDRKRRPVKMVVSTLMDKITFSRSYHACLGPLMDALFNFITNASDDKFRYNSHVGNTPSYKTTLRAMYCCAMRLEVKLLTIVRNPKVLVWANTDNVQHFGRHRVELVGRLNKMLVGMATSAWAQSLCMALLCALDYQTKQELRVSSKRDELTTETFLSLLDGNQEQKVFPAHWLWVLGDEDDLGLGELKCYSQQVLRTDAAIQRLPDEPVECFTLPTSSGSETELPELLRCVQDVLQHIGQTADKHTR
ncbi:hypothetical protein AAF712_010179 [Marasmius tenuissimus]|uniref:Uncharacterized protein n=1 Tax=Marasmius tenuissimus TaxID=585030 RepID=A0ABR2ZQF1_9AGAR